MITKELIVSLIEDKLSEDGAFLVELKVSATNHIYVEIDSYDGLSIGYCVTISKHIESQLDRDKDDFQLEVSTSSISAPFKVLNHYYKNEGRQVEISTIKNEKVTGLLKDVTDLGFVLETETMRKEEGKKKKQLFVEEVSYTYADIRSTKIVLNFK